MQFDIEVLNVSKGTGTSKTGKPYYFYEVAFKKDGKVEGKKLLEFSAPIVCRTLAEAPMGSKFSITAEKEGDFWQWKAIGPASGNTSGSSVGVASSVVSSTTSSETMGTKKGDWETRDERNTRQLHIIRQSSLANAINTLKTEKNVPTVTDVLAVAQQYVDWVVGNPVRDPAITDLLNLTDEVL
jgi:hypothetical protein